MKRIKSSYIAVAWISFASGMPLLLVGSTLQAWYTVSGVDLATLGALSLIGFPYLLKFLWSPFIDRFSWGQLGRRKGWIVALQLLLGVVLFAFCFFTPQDHAGWLAILAVVVAFLSATQDTAVDAYRADTLTADERGHGSAITNVAYRAAMMVAGVFALFLAAKVSWHAVYLLMGVIMLLLALGSLRLRAPLQEPAPPKSLQAAVVDPLRNFKQRFGKKELLLLVVFIIFYKFADALALSLNTTFLLRGLGFSLLTVGAVAKVTSIAGILLGSIIAGFLMPKLKLYRALWWFGWLQLTSTLCFAGLSFIGKNTLAMGLAMFVDFFCAGLSSVAFVVLLMALCDSRYTATQYAFLSALAAVARVLIGPIAAALVKHLGWLDFYILSFVLGIPVMCLLLWMRPMIAAIGSRGPGAAVMTENVTT